MIAVREVVGPADRADWLDLPRRVYPDWRFRGGQPGHEQALLSKTHPLSGDVEMTAFLAHGSSGAVGRCALSLRDGDPVARIGFFECLDLRAGPVLLDAAEALAASRGRFTVRGPFDPDFWVGYRMRLDHFSTRPFFGEPYNRSEYPELWQAAGYEVTGRYCSRILDRAATRDAAATAQGVSAPAGVDVRPLGREFAQAYGPIRRMVVERFAVMDEFQPINEGQFDALIGPLGAVLDRRGTQVAWAGDDLVGFATMTPDFGRCLDAGGWRARMAVLRHRTRSDAYVATYMATSRRGIGQALAARCLAYAAGRGSGTIAGLIHQSAPTNTYFPGAAANTHHYALFSKSLA